MDSRALPYIGLAALKMVSKSLPQSLGGKALKREFARKMVDMRGLPMKMAQVLSMSKDEMVAGLQKEALAQIEPANRYEVLERLRLIAPQLFSKIIHLSENGIVASLGQVHKVAMKDGRNCALKIKHEGIGPAMDLDRGLMSFLISIFGQFREGFSIGEYQKVLTDELRFELDYPYEVERQLQIFKAFRGKSGIVIPEPYPTESGDEHILMNWESSESIEKFSNLATQKEREEALNSLAEFHLHSILHLGMAHADPNPGNFGLRRGNSRIELVVYDYGSMVPIEPNLRNGFLKLIIAMRLNQDPLPILLAMGFSPEPLLAIKTKLNALCEILLEPFIKADGFRPSNWNRSQRVKDLLGPERWNFMISAPPNLFFIIRALHGLFHYAETLDAPLRLCEIISRTLNNEAESIGAISTHDLIAALSNATDTALNPITERANLRIIVEKDNEILISLSLPGNAVERLESIIDLEILEKIKRSGMDVNQIAESAKKNHYAAMTLFEETSGKKKVKVFLA